MPLETIWKYAGARHLFHLSKRDHTNNFILIHQKTKATIVTWQIGLFGFKLLCYLSLGIYSARTITNYSLQK